MTIPSVDPESHPSPNFPRSLDIATVSIYGLGILSGGLFLFLPLVNLLHPSPWQRWIGTAHGVASMGALIVVAYGGHLAFPLLRGNCKILPHIRTLAFWSALLSFGAIATGNLAYMRYRADINFGGAQAWIKENSPLTQYVLSEYHSLSTLFTLPLGVTCTWILWRYGNSLLEKQNRPILTATCLTLMAMMFFSIGGLVTGLGIAKIHAL